MSVRTDVINLQVNINGNTAQNNLNELRKKAADIAFEMKGLKKSTEEYKAKAKELSEVNKQMAELKKTIGITSLSQKELIQELNKLKALRGSAVPFSKEFRDLDAQIKSVEKRLYDVRNGVQGFASVWSKVNDQVKQFGVLAAGYLGFQFISNQFTNILRGAGKLSDQLADLRRVAGLTGDEAKTLNGQLTQLNTRTSTEGLREIAIIAGKLGVAKDDIFEFTKAVDQLVVALGDELGNADEITQQLGKILNVFEGEVNGDNITRLGNAFVELANAGVASGGFIAEFDQRLAGIAKSAGIGLGELSGLGAGLEELGARAESSTTAIQKLIIGISSDIPKAAKIAGMSTKEFNKLFQLDPTEALLKYTEGLVKNKASFAEVTKSLEDAGEEGARTIETISKLGQSSDLLRSKIALGKQAFQESGAITDAFNLKNETLGATLDKLGKEFNRLITSQAVNNFLQSAVQGALKFIDVLKGLPQWFKENALALQVMVSGFILLNLTQLRSIAISALQITGLKNMVVSIRNFTIAQKAAEIATTSWSLVTALFTGNLSKVRQEFRLLTTLIGRNPLGLLVVGIGAAMVAFNTFRKRTAEASAELKNLQREQKLYNELANTAAQSVAEKKTFIEERVRLINGETASLQSKKKAVQELIDLDPEFLKGLSLSNDGHLKGKELIDEYIKSLEKKAFAEAISQKRTEANRKIIEGQLIVDKNQLSESAQKTVDEYNKAVDKALRNPTAVAPVAPRLPRLEQAAFTEQNKGRALVLEGETQLLELDKVQKKYGDVGSTITDVTDRSNKFKDSVVQSGKESDKLEALREKYKAYLEELEALKDKYRKGENPEQDEIRAAQEKYKKLLKEAEFFYRKEISDSIAFRSQKKKITEAEQAELNEIYQKYIKQRFKESSEKEYDQAITDRKNFSDRLRRIAAEQYAADIIDKSQYEERLKQIESDELDDRIIISNDYAANVKKAAEDSANFQKEKERQVTQNLVTETDKRNKAREATDNAYVQRMILTSRQGSEERLKWQKIALQMELERELENKDLTDEERLLKEAEYNEKIKSLDQEFWQKRIETIESYLGYVTQALSSINTILNNRENAQLQKERAINDKRKKMYKEQLDNKLISQAQYDKKVAALQEQQEAREREMRRRQAKREKALNIFEAFINTAAAVTKALPDIAKAIVVGALGAIQIGAIASAPLPELGRGDWVRTGDKHSAPSGGINAKIERDEAVMSAAAMTNKNVYTLTGNTAQITSALNAMAGGRAWAAGAYIAPPDFITNTRYVSPKLPQMLADGGYNGVPKTGVGMISMQETNELLKAQIAKQDQTIGELRNMVLRVEATVSLSKLERAKDMLEQARQAGSIS